MTSRSSTAQLERSAVWGGVLGYAVGDWASAFGVLAGITDRSRDYRLAPDGPAAAFDDLLEALGPQFRALVVSRQVHGARIRAHASPCLGVRIIDGFDGHLSAEPGIVLAVTVADCVPVYLVHPASGSVALLHAGWRGVAAGVLETGVQQLAGRSKCSISDIVMHCGVSICGDCYEVDAEVAEAVGAHLQGERGTLDLRAILADRAGRLGIRDVTMSGWCTAHHRDRFHSHRGSRGAAGRQVAFLGRPAP